MQHMMLISSRGSFHVCTPNGHKLGVESYGPEQRARGLEWKITLSFSMADDVATALYVAALSLLSLFSLVSPIP